MREILLTNKDIITTLEQIEKKIVSHDNDIKTIFNYLRELINPPEKPRKEIGFKRNK
jgi:hypothetical protein